MTNPPYKVCADCGVANGWHHESCYHLDCDEDDTPVHNCGKATHEELLAHQENIGLLVA